jgi:exopolysaccharide biosynthesis polyprenyl glycosylphosphotransferase
VTASRLGVDSGEWENGLATPEVRPSRPPSRSTDPSHARARADPRSLLRRALFVTVDALAAAMAVGIAGGVIPGAVAFVATAIVVDLLDRRSAQRLSLSALDDAPKLALRGVIIVGVAATVGLHLPSPFVPAARYGAGLIVTALSFAAVAAIGRSIGYAVLRRLQAQGRLSNRALIVGTRSIAAKIARRLREHPEYGVVPLGFVDRKHGSPPQRLPVPLLGDVTHLPELVIEHGVHQVFVAFSEMSDAEMVELLRACDRLDCEIFVVPRLFELGVGAASECEYLREVPLIRLHRAAFRWPTWAMKRAFDVVLAAVLLVLVSPLMLGIAAAVRLEMGRNVLYRQVRLGLDSRPFELLKFRTLQPQPEDEGTGWSVFSENRVGPVGSFLRRSSLDELPQLWNVLRGQMSLVGPRPELPRYVDQFALQYPGYRDRLRVPAGVTGLAQVHDLRGATPIDDRAAFDNLYIEHWSLWRDVKILIRTVASVVRLRGR